MTEYFLRCPHCGNRDDQTISMVNEDVDWQEYTRGEMIIEYECQKCEGLFREIFDVTFNRMEKTDGS